MEGMEVGLSETIVARNARDPLAIAYQNAWAKLLKYYELTDKAHSIYAAAILLHHLLESNTLTTIGQARKQRGRTR